jgi:hypothetical protein
MTLLPMNSVIKQVIDSAQAELQTAQSEGERDIVSRLIGAILELAHGKDGIPIYVAQRIWQQATTLTDDSILCKAGERAALLGSSYQLAEIQRCFDQLSSGTTNEARYANEAAGRLVQFCAAAVPRLGRKAWEHWWKFACAATTPDQTIISLRIGAAALMAVNLSLAVEIALKLRDQNFSGWADRIAQIEFGDRENFLSLGYGRLLGENAQYSLLRFVHFADAVCGVVGLCPDAKRKTEADATTYE